MYENGELVNAYSGLCADIGSYDGYGNIGMYACQAMADQQWNQILWDGPYFSLVSKKSDQCLDVSGYDGRGEIATYRCEDQEDQKWKWIAPKWTTPVGSWDMIFCNTNGGIQQEIESEVYSTESFTSTTSVEIGAEIETGMSFHNAKVSVKISQSLASTWTTSHSSSNSIAVSCDVNDDGSDFTGGCLWQWYLPTCSSSINNVNWKAGITKCTNSMEEPN